MFRNKILVRATTTTTSPFLLLPLSLSSPSSPSLSTEVETLCWKLSLRWRLSCLFQPPDVLIVYKKPQFDSVARVVEEFAKALSSVTIGAEEEVESASLIAKAVECGLRSVMLDCNWRCVGKNVFVDSSFSSSEERTHVGAVNVQVQSESNDGFVFLVSPDVLRFNRHKIADLVGSQIMGRLNNDEEVILEDFNFLTSCTLLHSLHQGHVTGLSKILPYYENINKLEELWSFKHGLALHSDYFVSVQLAYGGCTNKEWFPSSFVLQGSGLSPAPQRSRALKAVPTFESFMKILGDWDFFSSGPLTVEEISSLANGAGLPNWEKVTSAYCRRRNSSSQDLICPNFIHNDILLALDFRTPKPVLGYSFGDKTSALTKIPESREVTAETTKEFVSIISKRDSSFTSKLLTMKLAPVAESITSDIGVEQTQLPTFTKNGMKDMQRSGKSTRYADGDNLIREKYFAENSKSGIGAKDNTSLQRQGVHMESGSGISRWRKTDDRAEGVSWKRNLSGKKKISVQYSELDSVAAYLSAVSRNQLKGTIRFDKLGMIEEMPEGSTKISKKQHVEEDLPAKVIAHHKAGKLQHVTVADLKCFLTSKNAKVGGKKEDLLRRATALLDPL